MSRSLALICASLVAAAGCGDLAGTAPVPAERRNLLLLTVDTLRADRVGAYGYPRNTSPAIDALALQGVLFETPIVQRAGTWPSLTSILTSLHPRSHGVRRNGEPLDASKQSVAELLRDHGLATAAFLTNMKTAPNRGFDTKPELPEREADATATALAIEWLAQHQDERFFLWLHLIGPHDPYSPPPDQWKHFDVGYVGPLDGSRAILQSIHKRQVDLIPFQLTHLNALYDADIAETDVQIGRLLAALEGLGLAESTLLVFGSDHGEELYDHNHYFFHSYSVYESVLRVPLLMRLPGVIPAGARVGGPVQSIDLAPTALELLGISAPPGYEGTSLVPRIRGMPAPTTAAFSELGPHIHSIRTHDWHYIYNPQELASPNARRPGHAERRVFEIAREELYDVSEDPRETTNLVAEHPDVAAALRERLEAWLAESPQPQAPQRLTPETRAELRALGYLE